ncbi:MAG: hydrogenase nickel incorporation protein HypB [Planctomycetes bacterium]|nr:hydrogenase nickel incorporation protein HypB [Planctomycetota bacterium]MBL7106498.1 hydrogenase nickel incorporation protein HypB [Phycisphaerae bacterium]
MTKKVEIGKKILMANEEYAALNAKFFADNKKLCLNMISSPGSGKTTILVKTITDLQGKLRIGVIEGDVRTDLDAQRIRATKAPAVQIETEGACHLSAAQVSTALHNLPTDDLNIIIIENVGNLVCPSAFELGETAKIAVLSTPEGDDKPVKYPAIFAKSTAVIINKIDLLGAVDFDIDRAKADILKLNKDAEIFPISAKTGQGMANWYNWLSESSKV